MARLRGSGAHAVYWKTQLPVDYIDTSLTINTFENVSADLSGGRPARLWYIIVEQTNNGATNENIVLEITINGTAYSVTLTDAVSGTPYYIYVHPYNLSAGDFVLGSTTSAIPAGSLDSDQAIPFDADSVGLIRVKQTTDVDGTSAQIEVNLSWQKLVAVA